MRITIDVSECGRVETLTLGRKGENEVTEIEFDTSAWAEEYGEGTLELSVQPNGRDEPYLATLDGNVWTLTQADLQYVGLGEMMLSYYVGTKIKESAIWSFMIERRLDGNGETPPDPFISWFERMEQIGAQATQDAAAAAQAKTDAEQAAEAASDSASAAAASAEAAQDALDEFTSVTASATTLEAGEDATADYNNGHLTFGIPKGPKGDDGVVQDVTVNGTSVLDGAVAKVVIPEITKTVTGNPIVIDDADGEVKSLNVELTPIQDLHGYDKPWAAGAGANKWDEEWEVGGIAWTGQNYPYTDRIRSKNYIPISPNTTYYAKTPTANGNIQIFYYDSNKQLVSYETSSKANETFTTPSDAAYMRFYTYSTSYGEVYNHDIAINYPSTVTTYSPYENECPISPHTSLPVRDTGKNLFDKDNFTAYDGVWINANKTMQTGNGNKGFLLPITGGSYVISIANKNATDLQAATFADVPIVGSVGLDFATTPTAVTSYTMAITASANAKYLLVKYNNTNVTQTHTNAEVLDSVQIEHGTTATDYAPYTGQTVTVPLNDLYGGNVDVIGGEDGEATLKLIDASTLGWSYDAGGKCWQVIIPDIYNYPARNATLWSDRYSADVTAATGDEGKMFTTGRGVYIYSNDSENAPTGQLVYPLATPTPLTTTPTALTLYKGDNVVSSDGDMCITYLQDRGDLTDFISDMKDCCEEVKGSLLEHLVDGSVQGSLRGIDTAQEDVNYTLGTDATALGNGTKASGDYSVAEGTQTEASGFHSHAEGVQTKAMQQAAHAEGASTTANALFAHAEGSGTSATGLYAHSEGGGTTASAESAHAEGGSTTAGGKYSHAEGGGCFANANYSHAEGNGTKAVSMSQHVGGEFNELDPTDSATTRGTYVEIIGNGKSDTSRSNARTLDWNGNEALQGALTLGKGTADEVTITAAQLQQLLTLI